MPVEIVNGLSLIAGLVLIAVTLWDALETVVLPRTVDRRLGLSTLYYVTIDTLYRAAGRRLKTAPSSQRERILGIYGPVSLILLIGIWAALLIIGFAAIEFGLNVPLSQGSSRDFGNYLYASAVTLFTLGYGDMVPTTAAGRMMAVLEAGTGFGFLALVIAFLPVLNANFSKREAPILLLDARAGSPPTGLSLLQRHGMCGADPLRGHFEEMEKWAANLLESSLSYPMLAYYRSQHEKLTWLAAVTSTLDSTAMILAYLQPKSSQMHQLHRSAELAFAMNRHLIVDLCYILDMAPREQPERKRLNDHWCALIEKTLSEEGFEIGEPEDCRTKLREYLHLYEPYLFGISDNLFLDVPPIGPKDPVPDSWETAAWDQSDHF